MRKRRKPREWIGVQETIVVAAFCVLCALAVIWALWLDFGSPVF